MQETWVWSLSQEYPLEKEMATHLSILAWEIPWMEEPGGESTSDSKEIKLVTPKGNQPWIFIGRTDVEAEAPVLWPSDAKSCTTGKDPDAG